MTDAAVQPRRPDGSDLVVDLTGHRLVTTAATRALDAVDPTPEVVLAAYLALVCTLRSNDPCGPMPLRQADLDVLAKALALAPPDVEARLVALMASPQPVVAVRPAWLRARVLVPAAGLVIAVTVLAALAGHERAADESPSPSSSEPPAAVVVGDDLPASVVPAGSVGLATPQVAERRADGSIDQHDRTDDSGSTTTTG